MASQLDVVNEALVRIGEKRIASINDTKDPNAVLASALWAETVKQVSRETPWKCLTTLATLTEATTAPAFGWTKAYTLPADFVRALSFNEHTAPDEDYFDINGGTVVTDATDAKLCYTAYKSDPSTFDTALCEAISVYLASKMCSVKRQDSDLVKLLTDEYKELIGNRAQRLDMVETKSEWKEVGDSSDILKAALLKIAEPQSLDFNDSSFIHARTLAAVLEESIREAGRERNWQCLTTRGTLTAADDVTPTFGWKYAYAIPADCLRIVKFNEAPYISGSTIFAIEGSYIYTDAAKAELVYVKYSATEASFDNLFRSAVIALVASKLATMRKRDPNLAVMLNQEYQRALSRAFTVDCGQRKVRQWSPRLNNIFDKARWHNHTL